MPLRESESERGREKALLCGPEASWPSVKEKDVNWSSQTAIWAPTAISEGCSYISKHLPAPSIPQYLNLLMSSTTKCNKYDMHWLWNHTFSFILGWPFNCRFVFGGVSGSAAVINEGNHWRRDPHAKGESVWIRGSPDQWQIVTGKPDGLIQIMKSVEIRLAPLTLVRTHDINAENASNRFKRKQHVFNDKGNDLTLSDMKPNSFASLLNLCFTAAVLLS